MNYILNASLLHREGASVQPLLKKATALEDVREEALQQPTEEQKRVITEVSRFSRDANFRRKVLAAYENRCAVTRAQLNLVDAAHILPVSVEGSTDETQNGIALSPTMHRAFDNALIYLDDKYFIRLNRAKADELHAMNLADGLSDLQTYLNQHIHLPADVSLRPGIQFIQQANKYRRILTS